MEQVFSYKSYLLFIVANFYYLIFYKNNTTVEIQINSIKKLKLKTINTKQKLIKNLNV